MWWLIRWAVIGTVAGMAVYVPLTLWLGPPPDWAGFLAGSAMVWIGWFAGDRVGRRRDRRACGLW